MLEIQKHSNELFQRWKQQSEKDRYSCFYRDSLMYYGENWKTEKDGKLFGTFLCVNSFSPVKAMKIIFNLQVNKAKPAKP
ncbi:MAG: hypothetical protein LBG80_15770 [Bacteroidales bacterium]|jgi:hypothetical protein|nr:hypothetical protein [Bacteroidales bacterium]